MEALLRSQVEIQQTKIGRTMKMRAKEVELTKTPVTVDSLQAELEEARLKLAAMAEQLVSQQAELD